MILFDLICGRGHGFEGWFRDGKTYEQQARASKIACPVCGHRKVEKAIMAPRVSRGAAAPVEHAPVAAPAEAPAASQALMASDEAKTKAAELLNAMRELRNHVEANADYVGDRFAETAREIHYGETDKRNIYGEASEDDARELHEEGVLFQRIPWVPRGN